STSTTSSRWDELGSRSCSSRCSECRSWSSASCTDVPPTSSQSRSASGSPRSSRARPGTLRGTVSDSPAMTDEAPEELPSPQLRCRRFGGGYRRKDVEETFRDLQVAVRALEIDLDALRARSEELEAELADTTSELEAYRTREAELDHALEAARTSL